MQSDTPRAVSRQLWQESLLHLITDPNELITLLNLPPTLLEAAKQAAQLFPLKVPHGFAARMRKGDISDPLLQQVLPLGAELCKVAGYIADPLQEAKVNPLPGLLHKYHGRVLVTLTSTCAVHCRYCFRRDFPYAENNPGRAGWKNIFDYIKKDESIHEVILSGGDPLAVSDYMLQMFSDQLSLISHVKTLRIHSRLPIVLPERITDELITWIKQLRFDFVLVVHANHAQEINEEVRYALKRLREAGVHILNQSVLLKGINDDAETLIALSHTIFSAGVLPYYLHLPDKVQGTAHFDVAETKALELHAAIASRLPGYLTPKLVREVPGAAAKLGVRPGP